MLDLMITEALEDVMDAAKVCAANPVEGEDNAYDIVISHLNGAIADAKFLKAHSHSFKNGRCIYCQSKEVTT